MYSAMIMIAMLQLALAPINNQIDAYIHIVHKVENKMNIKLPCVPKSRNYKISELETCHIANVSAILKYYGVKDGVK